MTFQWMYQAGNTWVPFESDANHAIENLWRSYSNGYVQFGNQNAYIHVVNELFMILNKSRVAITRTS